MFFSIGIVPHVFADIEAKKKKKILDRHAIRGVVSYSVVGA